MRFIQSVRFVATLRPEKITHVLRKDEFSLESLTTKDLPRIIESIECNQLGSNSPIEDRVRISSIKPQDGNASCGEPTLVLGVYDGHGGGTTVDLISRRLTNYIAASLYPNEPVQIKDLHFNPKQPDDQILPTLKLKEAKQLDTYRQELEASHKKADSSKNRSIVDNIRCSFQRCDDDLSREIQDSLIGNRSIGGAFGGDRDERHFYLSAAVSGCCATLMIIHRGIGYAASVGDCRAVLGLYSKPTSEQSNKENNPNSDTTTTSTTNKFNAVELIDEHNCDNVNEVRRLAAAHPASELNTIIKHERLLGHLMPFRAFGDFNYKWPAKVIQDAGITRAFGSGVIPAHYETPPYLIAEPDVKEVNLEGYDNQDQLPASCLVLATDGLWEFFESSREVIETVIEHSHRLISQPNNFEEDVDDGLDHLVDYYDKNCATHAIRTALCSGSQQDMKTNSEHLRRVHHARLEAMLTLPRSISRNFRDDMSIIVVKLKN